MPNIPPKRKATTVRNDLDDWQWLSHLAVDLETDLGALLAYAADQAFALPGRERRAAANAKIAEGLKRLGK